jgi:hypothetical protein
VRSRLRRAAVSLGGLAAGALTALAAPPAQAHPDVAREGAQIEGLIGGSNCIPGRAQCRADNPTLNGATRGAVGGGVAIGWRARRWFLLGAMYRGGMFRPDYEIGGTPDYVRGEQHSVYGFVRPILPIWRIDLGVNLAPGYSRQIFRLSGGDQDYTQGFSFMVGPVVDIFVTRHFFLGFEADFLFNAHRKVCQQRGNDLDCVVSDERHLNPVHQAIYGFHLGATFG